MIILTYRSLLVRRLSICTLDVSTKLGSLSWIKDFPTIKKLFTIGEPSSEPSSVSPAVKDF